MHPFLRRALDRRQPLEEADIEALLSPHPVPEGLHLDYKRGEWLASAPKEAPRKLRRWIASFANSDGGALVIGVADDRSEGEGVPAWSITGCRAPQGGSLSDWANDALRDLGVVHPTVQVIPTQEGTCGEHILVVAVERSHRLVPCIEKGEQHYYVRLGASTLRAEDWLLRDLFLSRRARPHLVPTSSVPTYDESGGHLERNYVFNGTISLENASPVWATSLHVSALGLWKNGRPISDVARQSTSLETYGLGELRDCLPADGTRWDLPPYGRLDLHFGLRVLDDPHLRGSWIACGALLLACREDLPRWMQLVLVGSTEARGVKGGVAPIEAGLKPLIFAGSPDEFFEPELPARFPTAAALVSELLW